jgi:hypothetical protein
MQPVEFLSVEQMSQQDRNLAAEAELSISRSAKFAGLEFAPSSTKPVSSSLGSIQPSAWSYQQLVCAALPGHLFLEFMRNNDPGDISQFTASIPRNGQGRVRVIPIQRRGYAPFSLASVNAQTVAAFNSIRAEEHPDRAPEWLATGLCYAALTGARPQVARLAENAENQKFPAAMSAGMEISAGGGAILRFADQPKLATARAMQWTLTFDARGKLLKAARAPAPLLTAKAVARNDAEAQARPVPRNSVDLEGHPVPEIQIAPHPVPSK